MPDIGKRASLTMLAGVFAGLILPRSAGAEKSRLTFEEWIAAFQSKALARGITPETYARVMGAADARHDRADAIRNQAEFNQQLWQYLNRACSDWKITAGREKAQEYAPLFARIEKDYRRRASFMLGVWGIEFGVRRSGRREKPHAPGHSVAGDARLGRAAPPHLLGSRN